MFISYALALAKEQFQEWSSVNCNIALVVVLLSISPDVVHRRRSLQ